MSGNGFFAAWGICGFVWFFEEKTPNKQNNPNPTLLQSVLTFAKGRNPVKCFMAILNLFALWLTFLLVIPQLFLSVMVKPQTPPD